MFRLRASNPTDADEVLRVLAARDFADFGLSDYTRDALLDLWRARDFDPASCAVVAEGTDGLIGYAALASPGALAFVDPAHEGIGVGTALLSFTESHAPGLGRGTLRQRVGGRNDRAHALLFEAGYRRARALTRMARRVTDLPPPPPPRSGISLSPLDVDRDAEALHEADERAFSGVADYEPASLTSFYDEHLASPNLDPELSRVARLGDKIVGFAVTRRQPGVRGDVDLLAVDPGERRRGLGTALLLAVFEAIAQAGLGEAWLEVASDNPAAMRLYSRAGMTSRGEAAVFEKPAP